LAVLAHIRHNHTRYDSLLKETSWQNARKVVEALCLDILVKWRGDEETGRDQLDEILREVVIISDSENDDSELETDNTSADIAMVDEPQQPASDMPQPPPQILPGALHPISHPHVVQQRERPDPPASMPIPNRAPDKRGFKRYQAWKEAIRRVQVNDTQPQGNAGPSYHHQEPLGADPIRPEMQDSRPMNRPTDHPSSNPRSFGFRRSSPRPMVPMDPIMSVPPARLQVNTASYGQPPQPERPSRPLMNPAVHGLQDLLVRSIEPASPDAPQSYYIRTLPPRGRGSAPQSPVSLLPQRHTRPASPPQDYRVGQPSYVSRRVLSNNLSYEGARYGEAMPMAAGPGMIGVRHGHPPRYTNYPPSASSVAMSVPHGQEPIPAPRMIEVPRLGDRSNPVFMEDRGSYYERVPVSSNSFSTPSMPAFVQIRRAEPEGDRMPQYPVAAYQDMGSHRETNSRYPYAQEALYPAERQSRADNHDPGFYRLQPRPPAQVYASSHRVVAQHGPPMEWTSRRPEEQNYVRDRDGGFLPDPRVAHIDPVPHGAQIQ
jgi:hypothetical protein